MNRILFILVCLPLLLTTPLVSKATLCLVQQPASVAPADTTHVNAADADNNVDDFAPGLLLFALIAIALTLICIGIGMIIAIATLFIVFGFVSFGLLSTSIIVGLKSRSFAKGFKTLLVSTIGIAGMVVGTITFYLVHNIEHVLTARVAIISGAASGLFGGLVLGLLSYVILKRLTTYFLNRLNAVG